MELLLTEKQLTNKDLNEFENRLDVKLPDEFKEFYLKWNGGVPSHPYYQDVSIQVFAPIKYGDRTIEERYQKFRSTNFIPDKYIPFGNDGGAWPLCIDLNPSNYGVIYIVPSDSDEIYFVANNFGEFIGGVQEEDNF